MSRHSAAALVAVLLSALPSSLAAQGLATPRELSLPMARMMADATLAECKAKGFATAAAVVDRSGQVIVLMRDELATPQMMEMARRKAITARLFRMSTMDFRKRTTDPLFAAQRDVPDVLALGGGLPVRVGTETIGGVASSGSSQETDEACAASGLAKVADLLK
jgi:uncharacterized protein GlcG (DUF336 family)